MKNIYLPTIKLFYPYKDKTSISIWTTQQKYLLVIIQYFPSISKILMDQVKEIFRPKMNNLIIHSLSINT